MKRKMFFIFIYVAVMAFFTLAYTKNEDLQRAHFLKTHQLETQEVQEKLQYQVGLFYQGLRTISRMPGVKKMDTSLQKITLDAERSIQEIYNNLKLSIGLSEVYLVPIDLEPDQLDPRTNKLQTPLISFDTVREKYTSSNKAEKAREHKAEIFEYRAMKKQNTWLKKYYPDEKYITNFEVPMMSGEEVVTCDQDRSGHVFSVPFYDDSGKLKGTVAGIVLSEILSSYLPSSYYTIESALNNYTIGEKSSFAEKLLSHKMLKLNFNDSNADWYLVASIPESHFLQDKGVAKAKYLYYLSLFIGTVFVAIAYFMVEQNVKLLATQQKALEASSKLASIGEMTASIAHEINNPLSIIVTRATLMSAMNEKGTLTPERINTDLAKLTNTAERIAKIVKGLKALSRNAEADPYEKVSIKKIVDDSLEFCSDRLKERNTELRLKNDLDKMINCREVQLSQVIINLINNASDAILELSDKWIELEVTQKEVTEDQKDKKMVITITDSGKGIPPEIAQKLMTSFFSTKAAGSGTGLGLSISQKIIKEHGGELRLDQSYHHTRFVIELPA